MKPSIKGDELVEKTKWKKIVDLKEGDRFYLRGSKRLYIFIAFCGGNKGDLLQMQRGIAFMKGENGKERHQKMFHFTLIKYLTPQP